MLSRLGDDAEAVAKAVVGSEDGVDPVAAAACWSGSHGIQTP